MLRDLVQPGRQYGSSEIVNARDAPSSNSSSTPE
jgi:hypothetical protein